MAKSKSGKRDEDYLGEIRKLKSENKTLKKRLKQLERKEHFHEHIKDDEPLAAPVPKKAPCPECARGTLEFKNVLDRYWSQCDNCSFRTKAKKL